MCIESNFYIYTHTKLTSNETTPFYRPLPAGQLEDLRFWQKIYPGTMAKQSWLKFMQKRKILLLAPLRCFHWGSLIPIPPQKRISPLCHTYRVIGKETHLCLPHPAISYCFKNTLWHKSMIHPKTSAVGTPTCLLISIFAKHKDMQWQSLWNSFSMITEKNTLHYSATLSPLSSKPSAI